MISFEQFLTKEGLRKHHVTLLVSQFFSQNSLSNKHLAQIMQKFCGIELSDNYFSDHADHSNHKSREKKIEKSTKNKTTKNPINTDDLLQTDSFFHPDVFIADRKNKNLKLEDIQPIQEQCLYPPQIGSRRFIFIENCERLTNSAANSLLKCIEEPMSQTFFLLTTSCHKNVLSTITSRAQKINIYFAKKQPHTFLEKFDREDLSFIENAINQFSHNKVLVQESTYNCKKTSISAQKFGDILIKSEELAKKYDHSCLQHVLLYFVSHRLQKDSSFIITTRSIVQFMREWTQALPLNPSHQYWLLRFFAGFSEN